MNKTYKIIKVGKLKQHERVKTNHLVELTNRIKNDGYLDDPIIADLNTFVVLDGHHRLNAVKCLGFSSIAVHFVDYENSSIKVGSWRENEKITKKTVLDAGASGKLLQPKTSRHIFPHKPTGLRINLSKFI